MSSLRQPQAAKKPENFRSDAASHVTPASRSLRPQPSRHRREINELSVNLRFTPQRANDLYERSSL